MSAEDKDNLILVGLSLFLVLSSLIGSFVVSGSLLDLICIITIVGATIQYILIDRKQKKMEKEKAEEKNILY
jgi:hypothetical protein